MSFIAVEPPEVITTPPADPVAEPPVSAGSFWPEIDLAAMRATVKLDGTVTPERLRHAVIEAIANVTTQLAAWSTTQQAAGHAALAAVPSTEVDGVSIHVHRYLRAVYGLAKADLIERYRDYDTTAKGDKAADQQCEQIDEQRRNAHWAIQDIKGVRRVTVELI